MANTPNKDHIRLWVDALRSGEYKQGIGNLRNAEDEYCCLGVACEICPLVEAQLMGTSEEEGLGFDSIYHYNGSEGILPQVVAEWLGLDLCNPILDSDHLVATDANDAHHLTFDEIADMIEREYLS